MDIVKGDVRFIPGGALLTSGVLTTVLGPVNCYEYADKSITLYNMSTVTLSGATVQVNCDQAGVEFPHPDIPGTVTQSAPNPGLWETIDSVTWNSLASAGVKSVSFTGNCYKWWRVQAIGTTDTTVSGYFYTRSV